MAQISTLYIPCFKGVNSKKCEDQIKKNNQNNYLTCSHNTKDFLAGTAFRK
jgi:hypothetical protein